MSRSSSNIIFSNLITFQNIDQTLSNFNLIGSSNRFITNDRYDGNINVTNTLFSSNLITSNLSIIGDKFGTPFIMKQLNINQNVVEFYNSNNLTFIINSNGKIGINTNKPNYNLDINGSLNANNIYINNTDISTIINNINSNLNISSNVYSNLNVKLDSNFNNLNTDTIYIGNSNRFITNDSYNRNITFTGILYSSNIITSNLNIISSNIIFNSSIYQTKQLQIVNEEYKSALIIKQQILNQNVIELYNGNILNFILNSNGNIGIGINNPQYKCDINGSLNCSNLFINNNNLIDTVNQNINSTSNKLVNFTNTAFNRLQSNIIGYNTTFLDLNSFITSNSFIINTSSYMNTHTYTYNKILTDSELLIQVEFPYKITGFGTDHYASRLSITSEIISQPEYSLEHEQIFIGYAAGGGTRSTTLSPLNHKTNIQGSNVSITVQIKLVDSDNSIITDKCIFIITEKKPSPMLYLNNNINENDIPRLTSNLYVNKTEFNNYGKWNSNNSSIYYMDGNVGIGKTNPNEKLDVNGNIIATGQITSLFSDIRLKTITSNISNALDIITKISGFKYKPNNIAKKYGYTNDEELLGVSAQEVLKYIPEIVSIAPFDIDFDNTGKKISKSGNNYLTVQYDRLIPYLIEAIKDLKIENDKLMNRIKKLEDFIFK